MNTLGSLPLLGKLELFGKKDAGQHWFVLFLAALAPLQSNRVSPQKRIKLKVTELVT